MENLLLIALSAAAVGLVISLIIFFKLVISQTSKKKTMIDFTSITNKSYHSLLNY